MPNHPAIAGIVVVSVAVAAAIAIYESPQARQFAEDVRRKIAIALHSLGDEITPQSRQPRFNRPEDAEGFMQSSAEPGVEADEESKRRQREELMYWNAVRLEKQAKEREFREEGSENEKKPANKTRGSSFDDFLQEDHTAEKGTLVYNTGADLSRDAELGLRQRGVRGLNRGSAYANPFADENNIDMDEQRAIDASLMSPEFSEESDDLYSASPRMKSCEIISTVEEQLVDTADAVPDPPVSYPTMEDLHESTNFTSVSARVDSAYDSIHAWADNANNSFYSPLPATPRAASPQLQAIAPTPSSPLFSDPPESVPGDITPTDSLSVADSGENVWAPRSGATSEADVVSLDGDGFATPDSWTEVGSVVSENDVGSGFHH